MKHSIEELRKTAFDFSDMGDQNTPASRKSHVSKDFKKLGFTVSKESSDFTAPNIFWSITKSHHHPL